MRMFKILLAVMFALLKIAFLPLFLILFTVSILSVYLSCMLTTICYYLGYLSFLALVASLLFFHDEYDYVLYAVEIIVAVACFLLPIVSGYISYLMQRTLGKIRDFWSTPLSTLVERPFIKPEKPRTWIDALD